MEQSYVWLLIIIFLIIIEAVSVNLTTIWFVISGFIALIMSFFIDDFMLEFGVFTILGIILLIFTRPLFVKLIKKKDEKTNYDRIIGMTGIVTESILKNKTGAVKVDGKVWTAYSDTEIESENAVKVLKIEGTKIKVEEIDI